MIQLYKWVSLFLIKWIFLGIGGIPNSTLRFLHDHKDLGIYTKMLSDGVFEFLNSNALTNGKKVIYSGQITLILFMGQKNYTITSTITHFLILVASNG